MVANNCVDPHLHARDVADVFDHTLIVNTMVEVPDYFVDRCSPVISRRRRSGGGAENVVAANVVAANVVGMWRRIDLNLVAKGKVVGVVWTGGGLGRGGNGPGIAGAMRRIVDGLGTAPGSQERLKKKNDENWRPRRNGVVY